MFKTNEWIPDPDMFIKSISRGGRVDIGFNQEMWIPPFFANGLVLTSRSGTFTYTSLQKESGRRLQDEIDFGEMQLDFILKTEILRSDGTSVDPMKVNLDYMITMQQFESLEVLL